MGSKIPNNPQPYLRVHRNFITVGYFHSVQFLERRLLGDQTIIAFGLHWKPF